MSDFSYPSSGSIIGNVSGITPDTQSYIKGYIPRKVIPWSAPLQAELLSFFLKVDYPFRFVAEIPFEENLRSEIRRFFISLDAYKESSNPVIPYRHILYGATDKRFALYLKRVRRKAFLTTWWAQLYEQPDWWNDVPEYHINDIGDIFNYAYLIFWQEDEEDDYLYGNIPVKITDDSIECFRSHLEGILLDVPDIEEISQIEVLSSLSSSVSIDESLKNRPHYKIKCKHLTFSKKRGVCKRCVIPVSPQNTRDTVISQVADLNRISLIEKQTIEVLKYLPGHIHLSDPQKVKHRLDSLGKKFFFFLHRDIRKEGITKPRVLLKVMLEELKRRFPSFKAYESPQFYDDYLLSVNDKIESMQRGHGLGMANALTTLMQLTIHDIIIDRLLNDIPDLKCKILCLNDDFVAGFENEEHLDAYFDLEGEVMDEFSLLRQLDKSFTTQRCFVLAERYYTPLGYFPKESYQRRELLLPYACYNIVHAKQYFIASQIFCDPKYSKAYIAEIASYWGYEFFPDEFRYPSIFGGWISDSLYGVDLSLMFLDQPHNETFLQRGYHAANVRMTRRPKGVMANNPTRILFAQPKIPEEFLEVFDYLTVYQQDDKYGRKFDDTKYFCKYWESFKIRRSMAFKKANILPFKDFLLDVLEHHKTKQFYPCECMIESYADPEEYRVKISDPYIDPNPRLAALSYWGNISYPFSETFSIRFTNKDATTKKSESLFSKEVQRTLRNEVTASYLTGSHYAFIWPRDKGDYPMEQFLNPIGIGELSSLMNWGYGYPLLKKEFWHPLIKEKREIFGSLLSLDELIWITHYRIPRRLIKKLLFLKKESGYSFKELIEISQEIIPDPPKPIAVPEEEDDYYPYKYAFDTGRGPVTDRIYVRGDDLFEEGCPVLWSTAHIPPDQTDYDCDLTRELFSRLREAQMTLTTQFLVPITREEVEHMVERMKCFHPFMPFLLRNSGAEAALRNLFNEEPIDASAAMGDLFGDGF